MTALLEAKGLRKSYQRHGLIRRQAAKDVLSGINLSLGEGESLAILGGSGAGKSTLIRQLLGLERPSSGFVLFRGTDLRALDRAGWREFRRAVQMVFQDSLGAVNPRHRVGRIIAEPLRHLTRLSPAEQADRVAKLLADVGLKATDAGKLPGQMSGGQLQRVCIARALATGPRLLVLDEAVSNLDITLQGQVIDLINGLRTRNGMAVIFITHDLRLVRLISERVIVLDQGRIVEDAPATPGTAFSSPAGRVLQDAILPALPAETAVLPES
jgi:nickel transport system ATP-binding protein